MYLRNLQVKWKVEQKKKKKKIMVTNIKIKNFNSSENWTQVPFGRRQQQAKKSMSSRFHRTKNH